MMIFLADVSACSGHGVNLATHSGVTAYLGVGCYTSVMRMTV